MPDGCLRRPLPDAPLAPAEAAGLAVRVVAPPAFLALASVLARAFEAPQLIEAIAAAPGGIEALVMEWSDPDKIVVTVGWTLIADRDAAAAFATSVRATRRSSHGLTAIGSALLAAGAAFDRMPEPAGHKVIDVSGDGMANFGVSPIEARDALVKKGITINGLAILSEEPWLDDYYRSNVIGGPSAFVIVAKTYESFAEAMLRKLVQEVASGPRAVHAQAR